MNKTRLKTLLPLFLILLLGIFVRFYRLGEIPIAINTDEAGLGYNAYAIFKTLRDEHGQFLPLAFKSFNDYKPPVTVYLLAPLTGLLGLTEIVIRAPIAITGALLILLVYLISKRIFNSTSGAIVAAGLTAISPWAINFSRATWEAGLALFFTTLAIFLFLKHLKKPWIIASLIVFMVAFYTYHAEKIAVPLLIVSLFWFFRKKMTFSLKQQLSLGIILFILAAPVIIGLTNMSGQSRARGSLITDYFHKSTKDKEYQLTENLVSEPNDTLNKTVFHSKIALSFTDITSKIFAYFSPANIFVSGDEVGRHGAEDFGVLYTFDFFLIVIAVYFFVLKPKNEYYKFLIVWLIVGLLPAMITMDKLHSIRSLLALPPLYILEAWGIVQLMERLKNRGKIVIIIVGTTIILILGVSFLRFTQSYFIYTPIERADWWQYGYKEVVLTVKAEQNRFDKVIVDVPPLYGNPYVFFLFYQQYDPDLYNQTVNRQDDTKNKATPVYGFGKYQFRQIYWPTDNTIKKTLFVGTDESLPKKDVSDLNKFKLIKEVNLPNGKTVFRIVETL